MYTMSLSRKFHCIKAGYILCRYQVEIPFNNSYLRISLYQESANIKQNKTKLIHSLLHNIPSWLKFWVNGFLNTSTLFSKHVDLVS